MGSGMVPVALALILWNSVGASDPPCRENPECRDPGGEAGIPACSGSCRSRLSWESPVFPGNGEWQPLSAGPRGYVMSHFRWNRFGRRNSSQPQARKREFQPGIPAFPRTWEEAGKDGKRSYSMEHFRWGKPVGRKRRPVKVYPNGGFQEEWEEENSQPEFRREEPWGEGEGEEEEEEEGGWEFPWDSRKEKRYGGFMSSERSRRPLVTLFKNAIGKSFSKDGQ